MLEYLRQGKVRNIFTYGEDKLLIVTTDRISAYDVVLPSLIPNRGKILTSISSYWFRDTSTLLPNHIITTNYAALPNDIKDSFTEEDIGDRFMLVHKTNPCKIECIVRGYISGSGWKDYQKSGKVCGIPLAYGLKESDKLNYPIYTPSTKADEGHDVNISYADTIDILGNEDTAQLLRNLSLAIYKVASMRAAEKGIIIADTKFEFGIHEGKVMLIDEVLTPDSSRFWDVRVYQPGRSQDSFDKQIIRDYLKTTEWFKKGCQVPGPSLPEHIINRTIERYTTITKRLMGA